MVGLDSQPISFQMSQPLLKTSGRKAGSMDDSTASEPEEDEEGPGAHRSQHKRARPNVPESMTESQLLPLPMAPPAPVPRPQQQKPQQPQQPQQPQPQPRPQQPPRSAQPEGQPLQHQQQQQQSLQKRKAPPVYTPAFTGTVTDPLVHSQLASIHAAHHSFKALPVDLPHLKDLIKKIY
jgi:hypothetical protein